ncbi:MAG: helix-turn-helix domain-containing protein [Anaerovoracaceae bacterium]
MDEIIKKIRNRRKNLGLTYEDLAKRTGLTKSTLQRYETGAIANLPLSKLEILANALNCSPAYLMGWEELPSSTESPKTEEEELLELREQLKARPELRELLSTAEEVSAEDIELVREMLERMRNNNKVGGKKND